MFVIKWATLIKAALWRETGVDIIIKCTAWKQFSTSTVAAVQHASSESTHELCFTCTRTLYDEF